MERSHILTVDPSYRVWSPGLLWISVRASVHALKLCVGAYRAVCGWFVYVCLRRELLVLSSNPKGVRDPKQMKIYCTGENKSTSLRNSLG